MHPLFHPLYVEYCTFFNGNQDYFECHEVLEDYWKKVAPSNKKHPLVGYIQLAAGMYHWRRNNVMGAIRLLKKAYKNFLLNEKSSFFEYVNYIELCMNCLESIRNCEAGKSFNAFQIRFLNDTLTALVNQKIDELPELSYEFLLNKHMLRNREDILGTSIQKRRGRR